MLFNISKGLINDLSGAACCLTDGLIYLANHIDLLSLFVFFQHPKSKPAFIHAPHVYKYF